MVVPPVVELLKELAARTETGVLEVCGEGLSTVVYLSAGIPVFAEEGSLGETLGRVLIRQGKLTPDQYSAVIERMTTSMMDSEQLRFGEVAVALGFVTLAEIDAGLREQVRAKVARCVQWRDPDLTFRSDAEAVSDVPHYPWPVASVIWAGIRRYFDPARCQEVWRNASERYPELTSDPEAIGESLGLGPEQVAFLKRLDGTRPAARAIEASSLDVVLGHQLLATLLLLDAAVLSDEPAAPSSRRWPGPLPAPPFTHPPAPAPEPPTSRRTEPRQGAAVERHRARLTGERSFQEGKRRLLAGELGEAETALAEAVRLCPTASEYEVYLEWTRFSLLEDSTQRLLRRRDLRAVAVRSLRQDPTLGVAHYVLAELSLLDGNDEGAQQALRMALRVEPRNPLVQRLLQHHGLRR